MIRKQKTQKKIGQTPKRKKGEVKPLGVKDNSPVSIKLKFQPRTVLADDLAAPQSTKTIHQPLKASSREVPAIRLKFKDTIQVINKMQEEGIITRYAVGGAVGATFYVEPVRTADVDIFVPIHQEPGRIIVTLDPFTSYLEQHNYHMKDEYWEIEGNLVQFMPIEGDVLLQEAIVQAREFNLEGVRVFVFSPEHLAAIALKICRPDKDVPRIQQFIREKALNINQFLKILERHNLLKAWDKFQKKYLANDELGNG